MLHELALSACLALATKSYNVSQAAVENILSLSPAAPGDIGPMHIPASWLPILGRIGFPSLQVRYNVCTNIEAGTWILAYEALHESKQSARQEKMPPIVKSDLVSPPPSLSSLSTSACIFKAAGLYHVPVALLTAVLRTEGGHVGQIHKNANGSYDIGPAQINSIWLPVLAKSGITENMILNDYCLNITIGAWILGQSMAGSRLQNPVEFWQHVGDYNSHTPLYNHIYALKVWNNLN